MQCQMTDTCTNPATMLDQNGYTYCTNHGMQRRKTQPCRKLRPAEIKRLENGLQITHY